MIHQDIEASLPVQVIVHLMEVKKNIIEELLPYLHKILEKLVFKGGSTHPPFSAEFMKVFVEVNGRSDPVFHDPHNRLPHDLVKANAAEVAILLGNEHNGMTHAIF